MKSGLGLVSGIGLCCLAGSMYDHYDRGEKKQMKERSYIICSLEKRFSMLQHELLSLKVMIKLIKTIMNGMETVIRPTDKTLNLTHGDMTLA